MTDKQYTLSKSRLQLFRDCPRCFYQQVNEKIKRPRGIFPSLPSGVDGVLKTYFDGYAVRDEVPPEVSDHFPTAKPFPDRELLKEWVSNWKGVSWSNPEGHTLMGAVDDILVIDEKLLVVDYKTRGYPLKDNTAGFYQDQMDIYNFLLRKNGHDTMDISALLFYWPKSASEGGVITFNTEIVTLPVQTDSAEQLFNEALASLQGEKPDAAPDCEYC